MYQIAFNKYTKDIIVVGIGGTGSFLAPGILRLLDSLPRRIDLTLIDFDRVEQRNLVRQNFLPSELGQYKAEALAKRLSREFDRPVAYSLSMKECPHSAIVVGCVDNGMARREIESFAKQAFLWVDAGNGDNFGQVLIGGDNQFAFPNFRGESCLGLPWPSIQRPEIMLQTAPQRSCAEAVQAGEQGPTINQAMAVLLLEVVRRLLNGTCPWMQLYLDLEQGTLTPVFATPENVAKILKVKKEKVMERR